MRQTKRLFCHQTITENEKKLAIARADNKEVRDYAHASCAIGNKQIPIKEEPNPTTVILKRQQKKRPRYQGSVWEAKEKGEAWKFK